MRQLSRNEMKNVLGGKTLEHCTWQGMCYNFPPITYDASDTQSANNAQHVADTFCMQWNCCTDVDCPGAIM